MTTTNAQILYCPRCLRAFRTRIRYCPADGEPLAYRNDDPLVGTTIGERYRVVRSVGRGGMGRVYQAEHVLMRKTLALKVLHGEMSAEPVMVERFHREARSSAKLDHPNIVRITDFGETPEGILYLVMEYLEGTDVNRLMKSGRPLGPERATRIALQTLEALEEAHRRGVVHRDLKPENMMLVAYRGDPEFLKLLDFGLATVLRSGEGEVEPELVGDSALAAADAGEEIVLDWEPGDEPGESGARLAPGNALPTARVPIPGTVTVPIPSEAAPALSGGAKAVAAPPPSRQRLTERGMVYGTPEYMSPEQARGELVDHRSDLYSLGVILFQMVTGTLPFLGRSAVEVLTKHVRSKPPSARGLVAEVPEELEQVIERALVKRADERWQTAREMHQALLKVAAAQGWASIAAATTPPPAARGENAAATAGEADDPSGLPRPAPGVASSDVVAAPPELDGGDEAIEVFGRYVLVERLARGGMGEVFLARSGALKGLAKPCVIKRMIPELSQDAEFTARFVDEIRLASRLEHGNIAQVFDMGRVGKSYYVAMEYVEGKNLREVLAKAWQDRVPIPTEVAAWMARALLSALAYAHRLTDEQGRPVGLVHRDVSPHNVMVSYAGDVKLVDFGLALRSSQERHTRTGMVLGKLRYLSPEQARGENVDRRSDIYSAGLVLYELLTGQPMFPGNDFDEVAQAVRNPKPRPPSQAVLHPLPQSLDAVVLKATHPDAERRYSYAEEMRDDLSQGLAELAPRMNEETVGGYMRGLFAADLTRDVARADRARRAHVASAKLEPEREAAQSLLPERAASWEKSASITIKRLQDLKEETGAIPLTTRRGAAPPPPARALRRLWPYVVVSVAAAALAVAVVLVTGRGGGGAATATGATGGAATSGVSTATGGTGGAGRAHDASATRPASGHVVAIEGAGGDEPDGGAPATTSTPADDAAARAAYRDELKALVKEFFLAGLEPTDAKCIPEVRELDVAHTKAARDARYVPARELVTREREVLGSFEMDRDFLRCKLALEHRRYEKDRAAGSISVPKAREADAFFKTMGAHIARAGGGELAGLYRHINEFHSRLYGGK